MAVRLIYIDVNGEATDITAVTSNYSRSDNVDALGMDFKFDQMANPLDNNFSGMKVEIGGKVVFSNNNKTVFEGIITDLNQSGMSKRSWTAYDFAFYLNKSEEMIQYNKVSANTAIQQLCERQNIPVGSICSMPTLINKIYDGQPVSEIIRDIIKQYTDETGNKVRFEVRENKLFVELYKELVLTATYTPVTGEGSFDVTEYPGEYSMTASMGDMKNKVMVVSSKEKHTQIWATAQAEEHIRQYGLLQKIEKVEDKETSKANQIAKKILDENDRVRTKQTVKLFGDDSIRAGRSLVFNQPLINLVGTFLVKNCTHSYSNNNHFMVLDLEAAVNG